ncbi:MAG: hypothetical protein WCO29_11705 [Nostocales cyanobacterium ELA583]|jgi:hypothetical protein
MTAQRKPTFLNHQKAYTVFVLTPHSPFSRGRKQAFDFKESGASPTLESLV